MTTNEYNERNLMGFEGDNILKYSIKNIVVSSGINLIIETGTYLGGTTNQLSKMGVPVITIEINQLFAKKASSNIYDKANVTMLEGDSLKLLPNILHEYSKSKILFFLDAHWGNVCPLLGELTAIAEAKIKPIIVIHDFYVPDTDLGFDSYNGQKFDWDFIRESIEAIYGIDGYAKSYNYEAEGARRGVIFIHPKNK